MRNWNCQIFGLLFLVGFLCSCSDDPTTTRNIFYEPVPSVHLYPTWVNENTIAFESKGARSVGPGWLSVVPENRGVVGYNLSSGEYEMLIPDGVSPNANYLGNIVVGFQGNNTEPIVTWTPQEIIILEEPDEWARRSKVCVNNNGTYLAWRNIGSGHEIGIWIYSLVHQEYIFVGVPDGNDEVSSDPVWHPTEDILLYRHTGPGNSSVVEFSPTSSETDTLTHFNFATQSMSYSPEGDQIVVFGRGGSESDKGIYILDVVSGAYSKLSNHWGRGLSWGEMGIVYNNACGELDNPGCGVLWLLNPTTGESHPITERFQFNFVDQE